MDRRDEARAAWDAACERMEDLTLQMEGMPDDTDAEVVETLEQRFAEAESEAARHKTNLDRLERISAAREDFMPDDAEAEVGEDGETRTPAARPRPKAPAARQTPRMSVSREVLTYEKEGRNSYFADITRSKLDNDFTAINRLQRHNREMQVESRVALSSTDGTGGDFVPPLWMMNEWTNIIRLGRPFANAVAQHPLPPNTDTISIPRLLTGTVVAAQADLGPVAQTDATTGQFSVPVKTVAGQAALSRQLLDRSQPGMDAVIFGDLTSDYNLKLDQQCVSGLGTGANAKGVFSDANRLQVTYTSGSPTVGTLYSKVADAVQQIVTNRGLPPDLMVMHPRRWAWASAAVDTAGRPLIVPAVGQSSDFPQSGTASSITQIGHVGWFYGLPVVIDGSIPTNLGASTTEDSIIVMRAADTWLMEDSPPKTRVDESILSATLSVVLQLWNYFAFTTERYSKSIATINGTGLIAPVF